MSSAEIIGLVVFLAVFAFAPMAVALCFSNRAHGSQPKLPECPHCGAQNRTTQTDCFCCGHKLAPTESDAPAVTVIQRVKQADDIRTSRAVETSTPENTAEASLLKEEISE